MRRAAEIAKRVRLPPERRPMVFVRRFPTNRAMTETSARRQTFVNLERVSVTIPSFARKLVTVKTKACATRHPAFVNIRIKVQNARPGKTPRVADACVHFWAHALRIAKRSSESPDWSSRWPSVSATKARNRRFEPDPQMGSLTSSFQVADCRRMFV